MLGVCKCTIDASACDGAGLCPTQRGACMRRQQGAPRGAATRDSHVCVCFPSALPRIRAPQGAQMGYCEGRKRRERFLRCEATS